MAEQAAQIVALLRQFSLFSSLTDAQLQSLLPQLSPRVTKHLAGETIVQANDPASHLLLVLDGAATAYHATADGSFFIAEAYSTGWLFGENAVFSTPGTWPFSVDMTKPGRLLWLCAAPLRAQLQAAPESAFVLQLLLQSMDLKNKRLIQMISRSAQGVQEKILTYFYLMNDKYNGRSFRLRMSREDFAAYLGVGRSSLFRELRALQEAQRISIAADNTVTLRPPYRA